MRISDAHRDWHLENLVSSCVGQSERERSDGDLRGWELEQRDANRVVVGHAGHRKDQDADEEHEAAVDAAAAAGRR